MTALPPALVAAVRAAAASARADAPAFALFDCDGTLWRDDVGEAFLRHASALGWVKLPGGQDPYEAYEAAVARDRKSGYAYAAQLFAGLPAAQVQLEAARLAAQWVPERLLGKTQALLALCREVGITCCAVSASQIDIVRAAVVHAGIPWDRCVGISTALDSAGRYTSQVVEPIVFAEGKPAIAALKDWTPIALGCGDSIWGDLKLLEAAQVAVAVGPGLLADEAARRAWAVL